MDNFRENIYVFFQTFSQIKNYYFLSLIKKNAHFEKILEKIQISSKLNKNMEISQTRKFYL